MAVGYLASLILESVLYILPKRLFFILFYMKNIYGSKYGGLK